VRPAPEARVIDRPGCDEVRFVAMMRDIDELMTELAEQYPGHTWTRAEVVRLMFLDLTTNKLEAIWELLADDAG
jgi:hypothetical protein